MVAGGIALANHHHHNHHHHYSASADNTNNGDENGNTLQYPSSITMDLTNGSSLHGTTDAPNATVMIDINGDGQPDYKVVSDANGNWSVPNCEPQLADQQNVTAWVEGAEGNKITTSITVDYHAPDLKALDISSDLTTLSGTTEPNAVVSLDLNGDGKTDYTIKADADGKYNFALADDHVVPGVSVLTITDAVSNVTTLTIPSATAPTIIGISDSPDGELNLTTTTTSTSPTIHGLGTPGEEVNIMSGGKVVGTTTVDKNGNWEVSLQNLPLGENAFTVNSVVTAHGTSSTDSAGRSVELNYTSGGNVDVVSSDSLIRVVATDNGEHTTQSIARAMPDGGYLIAWAQPEAAGSNFYDIKVNLFDAQGNVTKTLTLGKENTMDGYNVSDGLDGLNNFDVAVSPVDGSITVFYVQGAEGQLGYTGTSAVYQRFSSDGTELTSGPQVVAGAEEHGGLGGLLDAWTCQNISNLVTGGIDAIWEPISGLLQPVAGLINVDLDGLKDLVVDGLSNRLSSALYGTGNFAANIVQMDDGSVVFEGTRYAEGLDSGTLIDRLNICGFITELFTDIGLIHQDNFVSAVVEPVFNAVMDMIIEPVGGIADSVLEWVNINLGSAGSLAWSVGYTPDDSGELVKTADYQYTQDYSLLTGESENGFAPASNHNCVMDNIAKWIFGDNSETVGASQGLDATQVDNSTYAVVWQRAEHNADLNTDSAKVVMTLVDSTTGKHITSEMVLADSGLSPKVTTLADGSLVVTWIGVSDKDHGDVYSQHVAVSNGNIVALSAPSMVNTISDGTQGLLEGTLKEAYDVSALSNGGYVVTWTSHDGSGTEHLKAQLYDMTGTKVGGEMQIDSDSGANINDSSITALSDGGYMVSWSETNSSTHQSNILYSVFNQDGSVRASGEDASDTLGHQYFQEPTASTNFVGSDGADVIDAHASQTILNSGAGDDRIIIDSHLAQSVDGGTGHNTVVFHEAGAIGANELAKLQNIQTLDLNSANGSNTLTLDYSDVIKVSGQDKLFITGGKDDVVDLDQNKWTMTATGNKDGQVFNLYTYDDDHHTQVWIHNNVQVV
ncbi:hypothetical protein GIX45_07820 [Erwinia sp. CPCC 100877]|nr:hypothetical protein [Erwinia sp. CPCC 100877]